MLGLLFFDLLNIYIKEQGAQHKKQFAQQKKQLANAAATILSKVVYCYVSTHDSIRLCHVRIRINSHLYTCGIRLKYLKAIKASFLSCKE